VSETYEEKVLRVAEACFEAHMKKHGITLTWSKDCEGIWTVIARAALEEEAREVE
jgi:hypothetical protein